jgi:hypothetical protein
MSPATSALSTIQGFGPRMVGEAAFSALALKRAS